MAALLGRMCSPGLVARPQAGDRRGTGTALPAERQCATPSPCLLHGSFSQPLARHRQATCAKAAEAQHAETDTDVQIEGIDRSYCDEFECTSSPAVERNLRALARDITRVSRWTLSLFANRVQYHVRQLVA